MSVGYGVEIKKSYSVFVFVDLVAGGCAFDYFAENAAHGYPSCLYAFNVFWRLGSTQQETCMHLVLVNASNLWTLMTPVGHTCLQSPQASISYGVADGH